MKKFMTVLLVVAVLFTFSFGSAFATTDKVGVSEKEYMQTSDYLQSYVANEKTPPAKAVANVGITQAEKTAIVEELEDILDDVTDDNELTHGTYFTEDFANDELFAGGHYKNVVAAIEKAIAAVKDAKTSKEANAAATKAMKAVKAEKCVADLNQALKDEALGKIEVTVAAGLYAGETFAYNKTASSYLKGGDYTLVSDSSVAATTGLAADILFWFYDNGYETHAGITSDEAAAAFKAAYKAEKIANKSEVAFYTVDNKVDNTNGLTAYGVSVRYQAQSLAKALLATDTRNIDAVYEAKNAVDDFEAVYGTIPDDHVTDWDYTTANNNTVVNMWTAAQAYYEAMNFQAAYEAIKEYPAWTWVAHKADIEKLASDIAAYLDKYDLDATVGTFTLTNELDAILTDGIATLQDAFDEVGVAFPEYVGDLDAAAVAALKTAEAAFYNEYVASGIFGTAVEGSEFKMPKTDLVTTVNVNDGTEIAKFVEAYVAACEANLGLSDKEDVKDAAKLQAYLNNATLKVTTSALGNNKIRVQARFDTETYNKIVDILDANDYTISYQFYHKTAKADTYKAAKEKDRNYITYTKKSLKKGTKYKFQCAVIIKDAKGNVVATKDYKASTVGSRICR